MTPVLLVIDGHSLAYRAYYAFPESLTLKTGEPIHVVFGFTSMMFQVIDFVNPTHVVVCFDRKEPTFRHQLYEAYKSHRPPAPESLIVQVDYLKQWLPQIGVHILEEPGYEADDIMGTLSLKGDQLGWKTVLLTTDQDSMQLVSEHTSVVMNKKADWVMFTPEVMKEKYGFTPHQMVDYKALRGDSSDNIPGVPGIGEKTAQALLAQFSTLESVYQHLDQVASDSVRRKLTEGKALAFLSHELATIYRDVPLAVSVQQLPFIPNWSFILAEFKRLDFRSLERKYHNKTTVSEVLPNPELDKQVVSIVERLIETPEQVASIRQLLMQGAGCDVVMSSEYPLSAQIIELRLATDTHLFRFPVEATKQDGVTGLFDLNAEGDDFFKALTWFFEDETIPKITHQGKNLGLVLRRWNVTLKGVVFDTFLADYLVFPGKNQTPDELWQLFGTGTLSSELDSVATAWKIKAVVPKMTELLNEKALMAIFEHIEMPLQWVLVDMEFEGIRVDTAYLGRLAKVYQATLSQLAQEAYEVAGQPFNLNSPKQLADILFERLKLPVIRKTKTGYSTDSSVLEKLQDKHPLPNLVLQYRAKEKLMSTYILTLPQQVDSKTGHIHTYYNQAGALTGRLSSVHPNLQNIPIRTEDGLAIRGAFIPSLPDRVLVSADYSQIELRILAHLSQDAAMIETFRRGLDIHQRTASLIFNIPLNEVTKEQRYRAKAVNFGILYGMSAFGLSENLTIPRSEAQDIIHQYFQQFPTIKAFIESTLETTRQEGEVRTEFGRIRPIPDINSSQVNARQFAERTAVNTRIQGTAADIIKMAMISVSSQLAQKIPNAKLLLQVHDELVLDVALADLDAVKTLVKHEMESVVSWLVPLTVDVAHGKSWKELV